MVNESEVKDKITQLVYRTGLNFTKSQVTKISNILTEKKTFDVENIFWKKGFESNNSSAYALARDIILNSTNTISQDDLTLIRNYYNLE